MKKVIFIVMALVLMSSTLVAKENKKMENQTVQATGDAMVDIKTSVGDIRIRLYGETPKHRDNFLKLVEEGFYNDVLFHRVINQFMIQTGDPNSKGAPAGKALGSGDPGYELDAEIVYPRLFHKRGALAAARTGDEVNPMRRSSGSQFYIVTGKVYNAGQLGQMEKQLQMQQMQSIFNGLATQYRDSIMNMRRNRDQAGLQALQEELVKKTEAEAAKNPAKFTPEQIEAYSTVGGTPHLDGTYTVFGEVVSGMDVVSKIETTPTGAMDRPKEDIKIISMAIVK
ncbi:MAG: peptidylprolyl isomerase [Bacteroidales bacterium]|nr:peptidylprolyl isomerase [Bacteroidales bacterium]